MALAAVTAKFRPSKSSRDFSVLNKDWPTDVESYEVLEDCGKGVSATVQKVICKPRNEIVAVKKMDLENLSCSLDDIVQETATMRNYHHPNVLPLYTSFVNKSQLWMVMPLIHGGSVLHIMKYKHPDGLGEVSIATIMRDVLKALDYVHRQGGIHRDIKAGNILVDRDGCVYLADFGVSTSTDRGGSWGNDKQARMTFVGTPCWMAPEVMEQTAGYDNSADIWSFGITLLEMAHGHAPFAKFSPMKVLLMTLQNPPPTLDDKGKKTFSKAMRDLVTRCLQKDPRLRPTAAQLLEHKFFKIAKDEEYLAKNLLAGLPSLGDQVKAIDAGRAATKETENNANLALCAEEYKKGVSSWDFDVSALKAQAELEPDEPALAFIPESDEKEETFSTLSAPVALATVQPTMPAAAAAGAIAATAVVGAGGAARAAHLPLALPPEPSDPTAEVLSPSHGGSTNDRGTTRKGRFQIYNTGDEPPPLNAGAGSSESSSITYKEVEGQGSVAQGASSRTLSEEGIKKYDQAASASASFPHDGEPESQKSSFSNAPPLPSSASLGILSLMPSEPKKKGRFMIIANSGSGETTYSRTSESGAAPSGKEGPTPRPPSAPSPSSNQGAAHSMVPLNVLLPKLNGLMEMQAMQQEAIQRLMLAISDPGRARQPMSHGGGAVPGKKSRTSSLLALSDARLSPPSLPGLSTSGTAASTPRPEGEHPTPESAAVDGLDEEALRARLAEASAENCNLRLRCHLLESLLGTGHVRPGTGQLSDHDPSHAHPHQGHHFSPPSPSVLPSLVNSSSQPALGTTSRRSSHTDLAVAPPAVVSTAAAAAAAAAAGGDHAQ